MNKKLSVSAISLLTLCCQTHAMDNTLRLSGQRAGLDGDIISIFVYKEDNASVDASLNAAIGISKHIRTGLIVTGIDVHKNGLLPVSGNIYRIKEIHYDSETRLKQSQQPDDDKQIELGPIPSPEVIRRPVIYNDYIKIEKTGSIIPNADSTTWVLPLNQEKHHSSLAGSHQPDNWESRMFFNDIHQDNSGAWTADIAWQVGEYSRSNLYLSEEMKDVPVTKLTVKVGDVIDIPRLGPLKVDAILPATTERSAWLVMQLAVQE